MHLFKLHGQDKPQASWLPVCSCHPRSSWGVAGYPLTWPGLGRGRLVQGEATEPWLGQASPYLICVQGSRALCPLPTPACHVIPGWTV